MFCDDQREKVRKKRRHKFLGFPTLSDKVSNLSQISSIRSAKSARVGFCERERERKREREKKRERQREREKE